MEDEGNDCKISLVPILTWVKRGVAKENPDKVQLSRDQVDNILKEVQGQLEDDNQEEEDENNAAIEDVAMEDNTEIDDIEAKYDLKDYDDEEENNPIATLNNLTVFADPRDDENIQGDIDDDEEENENFKIRPDDNLLVVGHVEDDCSTLVVHVINEANGDNYVHHDIILPSYPLAFEWLNYDPTSDTLGNYLAVGDMTPIISVWDLDLVDCLKPAYRLGQKGSKKKQIKHIGHKDAVLTLSWNKLLNNVLASGSADKRVIIWDLSEGIVNTTLKDFKDKVTSIEFNAKESSYLLAGSSDRYVRLYDCRNVDTYSKTWKINGEVEIVRWNSAHPCYFTVGTSEGLVETYDIRNQQSLHSFSAHSQGISGISFSNKISSCMSTISEDGICKIWNLAESPSPKLVLEKDMKMGSLFVNEFNPDSPLMLATGGHNKEHNMQVWDVSKKDNVVPTFYNSSNAQKLLEIYGQFNESDFNSDYIFSQSNLPSTSSS